MMKKAKVAIGPTPPMNEIATIDGDDGFAWRFQSTSNQVRFLTKKFLGHKVIVERPILKKDFSFEELHFIPHDAPYCEEMGDLFGLMPWPHSWKGFPVKSIKLPKRVLPLVIISNLMPLVQHSVLSVDRAQLLYALLKNHKVDLASIIIDNIASISYAKTLNLCLGYSRVISKVLSHFPMPQ
ncbi:hypothetical protein FH972_017785 [Carpinus fangiana]|uniref:Uncharacterized protein n=1 Tax=Carpinus fangiana TaxID=176857 RepID=A0A5N6RND4_9ROSI|nr:hypothetical protein FH972_017785 [Carpinus fangiana]